MQVMWLRAAGFTTAVDACARDNSELWFLSMLGNQQTVRAIWARMVKGERGYLSDSEAGGGFPSWLARAAWGTWRFHAARLPSGSAHHGLLVPEASSYVGGRPEFLVLARSEDETPFLHYRFLNRGLDLPLHPAWSSWLWQRGLSTGEITALESLGIHGYLCRPDPQALQRDLTQAVRRRLLPEPVDEKTPVDEAA